MSILSWKVKGGGWSAGMAGVMSSRSRGGRKMITIRIGTVLTIALRHSYALALADALVDCVEADRQGEPVEVPYGY